MRGVLMDGTGGLGLGNVESWAGLGKPEYCTVTVGGADERRIVQGEGGR